MEIEVEAAEQSVTPRRRSKRSRASTSLAAPPDALEIILERIDGLREVQNEHTERMAAIQDQLNVLSAKFDSLNSQHIGSLGGDGTVVNVSNIHVKHSILNGTQNGARIKTYQTGAGQVQNIQFSDLTFIDAGNPIIIDQYYCGSPNGCPPTKVGVKINNVLYSKIRGTSKSEVAVNFNCSENVACTAIKLSNTELISSTTGKQVSSSCNNAFGEAKGTVEPKSCLRSKP
ncbi:polygalacturonase QRT2-like [Quercus suber]|uniref:polygalacturonase QRT2-like n=1 Tax=Quercus suber TaxID=58331 RepID=UPI0032DE7FAB